MSDRDSLIRFLFEHADVRGEIVHLDTAWQEIAARNNYPAPVKQVLGEAVAAAVLLNATLKMEGEITLQIQGDGPLHLVVVQCTSEKTLRAVARWHDDVAEGSLSTLCGDANLVITIDPRKSKERYQGIVKLVGENLAQVLEGYFQQSEQLPTHLWLAADDQQVAGMLLQKLPHQKSTDQDLWQRVEHLSATITGDELLGLDAAEILRRLFHEEDVRLFETESYRFDCSCSREAIEKVLRQLGYDELQSMLSEAGRVESACQFCNQEYTFDAVDVEQLFAAADQPNVPPTQH